MVFKFFGEKKPPILHLFFHEFTHGFFEAFETTKINISLVFTSSLGVLLGTQGGYL
jgi:hypothetical protein